MAALLWAAGAAGELGIEYRRHCGLAYRRFAVGTACLSLVAHRGTLLASMSGKLLCCKSQTCRRHQIVSLRARKPREQLDASLRINTHMPWELSHLIGCGAPPASARVAAPVMMRLFPAPPRTSTSSLSTDNVPCAVNRHSTATMSYVTRTLGNLRKIGLKVCVLDGREDVTRS